MFQESEVPLDLTIEGGIDSPLGRKIVIAEVYHDGLADRNGNCYYTTTFLSLLLGSRPISVLAIQTAPYLELNI